jgi:acylphosphatase
MAVAWWLQPPLLRLTAEPPGWFGLARAHDLRRVSDDELAGTLDGRSLTVTLPLGGHGPYPRTTLFTVVTGAQGIRCSPRQPGSPPSSDFFTACRAVAPRGEEVRLHRRLRQAWLAASQHGFVEVLPDGRVQLALDGDHRAADDLLAAVDAVRALARAVATPRSDTDLATDPDEAPDLRVAALSRLAGHAPDEARQVAVALLDASDPALRARAAAELGVDEVLRQLSPSAPEGLAYLPVERLIDAARILAVGPLAERYGAVRALAERSHPDAVAALTVLLADQRGMPRQAVHEALWRVVDEAVAAHPHPDAVFSSGEAQRDAARGRLSLARRRGGELSEGSTDRSAIRRAPSAR